jgi:hypothetical protein
MVQGYLKKTQDLVDEIFSYDTDKTVEYTENDYYGNCIIVNLCNKSLDQTLVLIYDKYIIVSLLGKCTNNNTSGTKYLTDIIHFSKVLKKTITSLEYIKLSDISKIDILDCKNVSLFAYSIITKGRTWYNKHGFFSRHHEQDTQLFNDIRKSTFRKLKNSYPNCFYETITEEYMDIPLIKLIPLLEKEKPVKCNYITNILNAIDKIYSYSLTSKGIYDSYFYYDLTKEDKPTTGGKWKTYGRWKIIRRTKRKIRRTKKKIAFGGL